MHVTFYFHLVLRYKEVYFIVFYLSQRIVETCWTVTHLISIMESGNPLSTSRRRGSQSLQSSSSESIQLHSLEAVILSFQQIFVPRTPPVCLFASLREEPLELGLSFTFRLSGSFTCRIVCLLSSIESRN